MHHRLLLGVALPDEARRAFGAPLEVRRAAARAPLDAVGATEARVGLRDQRGYPPGVDANAVARAAAAVRASFAP